MVMCFFSSEFGKYRLCFSALLSSTLPLPGSEGALREKKRRRGPRGLREVGFLLLFWVQKSGLRKRRTSSKKMASKTLSLSPSSNDTRTSHVVDAHRCRLSLSRKGGRAKGAGRASARERTTKTTTKRVRKERNDARPSGVSVVEFFLSSPPSLFVFSFLLQKREQNKKEHLSLTMKAKTLQVVWHSKQPVFSLDFHPSGLLATGGGDKDVKVKG